LIEFGTCRRRHGRGGTAAPGASIQGRPALSRGGNMAWPPWSGNREKAAV
jgi:hypothetical protein